MLKHECKPGFKVIYVAKYRNPHTGKLMIAAHYGLKAWRFVVKDR